MDGKYYIDESASSWMQNEVDLAIRNDIAHAGTFELAKAICGSLQPSTDIPLLKQTVNRLLTYRPLAPIDDTKGEWTYISDNLDGMRMYQSARYYNLWKYVEPNGNIRYIDRGRTCEVIIDDDGKEEVVPGNPLVNAVIGQMFPISMPYIPPDKPYKVYCREYIVYEKREEPDLIEMLYAIAPDGENIPINRYFVYLSNDPIKFDSDWYTIDTPFFKALKKEVFKFREEDYLDEPAGDDDRRSSGERYSGVCQ